MSLRYVIEDEWHAEQHGVHDTFEAAVQELEELARIPWDKDPNLAPCQSWKTCGRRYEIIEYDTRTRPWKFSRRVPALEVSAQGVVWDQDLPRERPAGGREV